MTRFKKKILFIMPALPGGGAEKVLIDILKRIDREVFSLSLLLLYREDYYTSKIPDDVEVLYIHKRSTLNHERLMRQLKEKAGYHLVWDTYYRHRIRILLKHKHYDSIVSFMEGAAVRMHSYIFDKASRNVSWVHIDLLTKHWSKDFFKNLEQEKSIYEKMDGIAFVSNEAKEQFKKLFDFKNENLQTIYNPIPRNEIINSAKSIEIDKEKFTIVLVGRLNRQKRFDRAIEVAKKLHDDGFDFEMWIIGEGELRAELNALIDRYDLNDVVKLFGFKNPPYPYMTSADLYLSTSDSEGYPLTLCEALCLGIPVVSTNTAGPTEILQNSRYGILCEKSVESVYLATKGVLVNPERLKSLRESSRERGKNFNPEKVMNEIYAFL